MNKSFLVLFLSLSFPIQCMKTFIKLKYDHEKIREGYEQRMEQMELERNNRSIAALQKMEKESAKQDHQQNASHTILSKSEAATKQ